jgi:hypothetical protein
MALQGRNELPGMIELVEHVLAHCRVCAQIAYGAFFLELVVEVVQIRNRFAQVHLFAHNTISWLQIRTVRRMLAAAQLSNVVSTLMSMPERRVMCSTEGL